LSGRSGPRRNRSRGHGGEAKPSAEWIVRVGVASLSGATGRDILSPEGSSLAFSIRSAAGAGIGARFRRFTGPVGIDPRMPAALR
jgi:hypothetical protein